MNIIFVGFWNTFNQRRNIVRSAIMRSKISSRYKNIYVFNLGGGGIPSVQKDKCDLIIGYSGESKINYGINADILLSGVEPYDVHRQRWFRLPHWLLYCQINDNTDGLIQDGYYKPVERLERKNKCVIVQSVEWPYREEKIKNLSSAIDVERLGGKYRPIASKIYAQSFFKFSCAFENTASPGYTTEKILESYISGCVPIWSGSKYKNEYDFDPLTFIDLSDPLDFLDLISRLKSARVASSVPYTISPVKYYRMLSEFLQSRLLDVN